MLSRGGRSAAVRQAHVNHGNTMNNFSVIQTTHPGIRELSKVVIQLTLVGGSYDVSFL